MTADEIAQQIQTPEQSNPWIVAFVVCIATFMEVLDTTIITVAISHISGSLGASNDEGTWVLTSYLVANGIILPISGWLANVLGRKNYFLLCIVGFTITSFACGAASSLEMLVFFRVLQGLAGGGLQPISQSIILDAFPPEKRGAAFGITGITIIAAPIIGPTLGGWITDNFSWHWIFFINVPVGIIAFLLSSRVVHDPEHAKAQGKGKVDYIGLSLIALGLGTMQIMLDKGQQEDWFNSTFIITLFLICSTALTVGIWWLWRQKDAIVDLHLLKDRSYGVSCVLIFFIGFVLYASSALLPLLVQTQFGYDATLAGLVLSPGGIAVMFLMPIAGKLVSVYQSRYLAAFGMILCTIGMIMTIYVTPQSGYHNFVWMRIFQVLGLPFLFIPVSTLAFLHIPPEKVNKASALFALCRNLGGSAGIAVVAAYISRRSQVHQNILSSHLVPSDPVYQNMLDRYTRTFLDYGASMIEATNLAIGKIYGELLRQAAILSYSDAFVMMSQLAAFGIVLCFLLPKNDPKTPPQMGAAH